MKRPCCLVIWLMCVSVCLPTVHAAKILFLYSSTYNHLAHALPVARELASRGHKVWNALPLKTFNSPEMHAKGVTNVYYKALDAYDMGKEINEKTFEGFWTNGKAPILFHKFREMGELILRDTELFEKIKNLDIDLVVLNPNAATRMLTILAYKLDKPFIFLGPTLEPQYARVPFVPAVDPGQLFSATPVMEFQTRFLNVIVSFLYYIFDPFAPSAAVGIFAPEKPYISLDALIAKASMWLITQEPLLDYPKATMPNTKFVGSITAYDQPPLPDSFKQFMDKATNGAVIVSFGSMVKSFPDETVQRLLGAFAKTNYRFVFRVETKIDDIPDNVMTVSWISQSSLLAHPNTRLFITHCGAAGQNEAFLNGVPMIGFPMFAEQGYNSMRLVFHGFGLRMNLNHFTVEELAGNIREVIENRTYSTRIKHVSDIAKQRNISPKEQAVYWIEHVIQYGDRHLRSYGQDMPLYQYLSLDVIGVLICLIHTVAFSTHILICFCIRRCRKKKHYSKTKSD